MKNPEKKKSFRQTREEFQRRKKLAEKKQKEEERKQKYLERKEAIEQYKAKKNEKYKVLSKKTKKGQPLLAGRIDLLLEKIKATTDSWNKNKVVQKYSIYNLYCTTKTEIVKGDDDAVAMREEFVWLFLSKRIFFSNQPQMTTHRPQSKTQLIAGLCGLCGLHRAPPFLLSLAL